MWKALSDEIHAIVAALVGGGKYGLKVRLPHAVVMTFLFRNDLGAREKLRSILQLAVEHASNLAMFAMTYKTILSALKWAARYIHLHPPDSRVGMLRAVGRLLVELLGTLNSYEFVIVVCLISCRVQSMDRRRQ